MSCGGEVDVFWDDCYYDVLCGVDCREGYVVKLWWVVEDDYIIVIFYYL